MEILCVGGTGMVGSEVVARLKDRNASVRCMTRSSEKAGKIRDGVHFVAGDLEDPSNLGAAFEGVDRVHLLTPLHPHEAVLGRNAVRAAEEAGVARIVLHSVHRADEAPHIPHFRSKIEILDAIRDSGIPWAAIEPNSYFQNDYRYRDPILGIGIYPQPLGSIGTSLVDVRDISDATVSALLDDGHEGTRYAIVGPEALTGAEVAATWTRHVGREVRYAGDDLEAWERANRPHIPEWLLPDLKRMYAHFIEHGLHATDEELERQLRVLGHEPRDYDSFVRETVAAWTGG
ncbi:MAG: SDR family oxidoreductase [Gemmatimonadota bacterium]